MNRKTEVIIAVAIIVALILVLVFLLRSPEKVSTVKPTPVEAPDVAADSVPAVAEQDIPAAQEVSAATMARVFGERFGSYSTESGYENIDDVLPLATDALQRTLQTLAEDARNDADSTYYGVSSRIITVKNEVTTDTTATFLITMQREESFDTPGNTSVRYQDIRVSVVFEEGKWKVSDFVWL